MSNTLYWIWLQLSLGAGARVKRIFEAFGSARQIYETPCEQRRGAGCFTPGQLRKMQETTLDSAEKVQEQCARNGWGILTPDDELYPSLLRGLPDFPLALYLWGNFPDLDEAVCIGIVGTRNASRYGVEVAHRVSAGLVKAGAVVVSGGALGIDTAAHKGALSAGGKTIAVLGCGFGTDYLMTNEELRKTIAATCCVITEFVPFSRATKFTFPIRNRLISGLSLGTVVIEAAVKSGALITARLACEQGRDVFAVAGSVINPANAGTNRLIHDGAKPVFSVLDILEEYADRSSVDLRGADLPLFMAEQPQLSFEQFENKLVKNARKAQNIKKEKPPEKIEEMQASPENVSDTAKKVWQCLENKELHVDELAQSMFLTSSRVLAALTELEMEGLVIPLSGRRYCRSQNRKSGG